MGPADVRLEREFVERYYSAQTIGGIGGETKVVDTRRGSD